MADGKDKARPVVHCQDRDPRWMLLGMSNRECTPPRMGSAANVDGAKAALLAAWQLWRAWAEL